ncbi:MAG TPA: Crp/Fnr family transcriptional regulator [Blastocatellia bacterium]|nr:Crp/Fnr family transcriptional regulator [Blastocatellia bacterium]
MISLARNRILAALPERDLERLLAGLGSVHLHSGDILYHAGEEIRHVYFPEQGLISLVATMMDGATVETGIVGNEGMMGVPVLLGAGSAPYRAIVQVEGQSWRLKADVFKYEMLRSGALHRRLLLYTQALMTQMSQMAACNCLHTVEERLCSLLLMIDDRMDAREFFLTHEMIAEMLGARRAGITVAAGRLRQAGVISYMRGHIHILDRRSLEMWACECYRTIKTEFDRLFEIETESEFEKTTSSLHWAGSGVSPVSIRP